MRVRRLVTALAALLAVGVAVAPAARATAPVYPPPALSVGIDIPLDIDIGEIHVLIGHGFAASISVRITVGRQDRNGDPNVRGFAGILPHTPARLGPLPVETKKEYAKFGHLVMACARSASCTAQTDANGDVSFPIHFFNSHTHVITVTGNDPDGSPLVLQEVIVPETDCDESDGGDTEIADTNIVPDCTQGRGVGGTGSNGGSASGSLPNTGSNIGLPLTAGAILVLAGAGLVTVFRRRRGNATA